MASSFPSPSVVASPAFCTPSPCPSTRPVWPAVVCEPFAHTPVLPALRPKTRLRRRRHHRHPVTAEYLPPTAFSVDFDSANSQSGNFGAVFFGQYTPPTTPQPNPPSSSQPSERPLAPAAIATSSATANQVDVVVKCPVNSPLGRQLYEMERHTNFKLARAAASRPYQQQQQQPFSKRRFPLLLGQLLIPSDTPLADGLARLALVWHRSKSAHTLEHYLNAVRINQLASILNTTSIATPLRKPLCATLLRHLVLILIDLQACGIVHRDIKPDNLLVVTDPTNESAAPIQVIDFGSSCDWNSPFKKGLRLATCDPTYTAPERRLDLFRPALRFDVYSIALIALRAALPSLTDPIAMNTFVSETLPRARFSLQRLCAAVSSGRIQVPSPLMVELAALEAPCNEDMFAILATMLTETPEERASIADCFNSRFLHTPGGN